VVQDDVPSSVRDVTMTEGSSELLPEEDPFAKIKDF
jgi:hypothetical protein